MITIEYENTLDDVIAWNTFHYKNSPSTRRKIRILRFAFPVIMVLLLIPVVISGIQNGFTTSRIGSLTIYSIIAIIWLLFLPQYYLWAIRRTVKKLYKEGDNKGSIGKHVLTITSDDLIETTEVNETKQKWSGVEKIVDNDDYIFIYISAVNAHIIPKRAFENESAIAGFVETANQYKEQFLS